MVMQLPYQPLSEKKKFGIDPDIVRFDELGEISKEGGTFSLPQYLVEPPYMEGIFVGCRTD